MSEAEIRQIVDNAEPFRVPTTLKAYNVAEFLGLDLPPRELILAPFLPVQGLVMIYAARGIGKTMLALGITYSVASGADFLTWTVPRPRRVLIIDGEMPAATMQERLASIVKGASGEPPANDFLRIVNPDTQDQGMPDLATQSGQAAIEEIIGDAELIVLDNLSTLCRAGKENEGEGWLPVQEWALGLRRQGRSVLFIHHAGKGGNQRGTSRREDALDCVLCLKRPADYCATQGARFEVHFEKSRGFSGSDANPCEVLFETRGDAAIWTVKGLDESRIEAVARLLNEGLSQTEIADQLSINKSNVSRAATKAREAGLLRERGDVV